MRLSKNTATSRTINSELFIASQLPHRQFVLAVFSLFVLLPLALISLRAMNWYKSAVMPVYPDVAGQMQQGNAKQRSIPLQRHGAAIKVALSSIEPGTWNFLGGSSEQLLESIRQRFLTIFV